MTEPAEELASVRKIANDVMESLGWRRDRPALLKGAEMFWRRVSRSSAQAVYTDLAVMALERALRDHEAEEHGREAGDLNRRMDAVRGRHGAKPAAPPASPVRHTSESPGFAEPAPIPVPPMPFVAATPAAPVVHPESATCRNHEPAQTAPAAPPAQWVSRTARAAHDLWPELGTTVIVASGARKEVAKCDLADVRHQIGIYSDKKTRATKALAEAGSAVQHWQEIRDALMQHGAGLVEDLPAEVKNRLFERRTS